MDEAIFRSGSGLTLHRAFDMGDREVVSIVGGGGKTTILYRLAAETVAAGGKAIVTGTTRFTPPEGMPLPHAVFATSQAELLAGLRSALEQFSLVVVGTGWGNKGRILPVESAWLPEIAALPGVRAVIAEADGSKGRPFKAPAAHEPVVAVATTLLVSVVGIDVLGKPLLPEFVHRAEIAAALTGRTVGSAVDAEVIARLLLDARGGRKGLPPAARWLPVINKVEIPQQLAKARQIAHRLLAGGAQRVIVARAAHASPVVELASAATRQCER
ncbi:MAG: selenium cofactor biosynthesis protein YqeC [Dehalococcoidia bacterium]